MSRRGVIEVEKPQQCDKCGKIEELRPYGPSGSRVCHPCAMEDEPQARARFEHHVLGRPLPKEYQ
jgi:hypothetical protein